MIAIDTNVLIRLLVADSPDQTVCAETLIRQNPVWVSATVVLEAGWVLSSRYGFTPTQVVAAMTSVAGLPGVTFEKSENIQRAFDAVRAGFDFADAIHLLLASDQKAFATFDKDLVRRATTQGLGDVILV